MNSFKIRNFKNGHRIFNTLYRRFQEKNFECDNEKSEEYSIVVSQLGPKKPWINKSILYDYLEIAERLGMKVELNPNMKESIDDEECIFAIGRISKVTKTKVYFQHFDADGIWEEELWEIPFTEITSVSFGTRYVETFSKYI